MANASPTLSQFLSEIHRILASRDGVKLRDYLVIEPPYQPIYKTLISEIRSAYPKGRGDSVSQLDKRCTEALPLARDGEGDQGAPWSAFTRFMVQYFGFLRDVDVGNLLETYNLLSELLQKANGALTHPTWGTILLPTVVSYSKTLSRLAIGLDKQPHLIAHLVQRPAGEDSSARETLPERAANILRQAFVTCLNDRSGSSSSGLTPSGQPEGKKRGIYTIANLCLKILFACRKIRGAAQIFENIYNQSPPLSAFPKSERVAYLYYLGRFLWANSHFYRAQAALQRALDECHGRCTKQARLILIYLIASNLACGRFARPQVLLTLGMEDLWTKFEPLYRAIAKGNIAGFRRMLSPGSPEYVWFAHYRLDLQLKNRCEVYVWRSLVRRTFLICGHRPELETKKSPSLNLEYVVTLFKWQERLCVDSDAQGQPVLYVDPDFEGLEGIPTGEAALEDELPTMDSVVSKMTSLIHQDLLGGHILLKSGIFAISGARTKGVIAAGFPQIWSTIKVKSDEEVPGWKQDLKTGGAFSRPQFGPGQVINLSGAKPVGVR